MRRKLKEDLETVDIHVAVIALEKLQRVDLEGAGMTSPEAERLRREIREHLVNTITEKAEE